MNTSWFQRRLGAIVLALFAGSATAHAWPARPINRIVPFQTGSSPDITVRAKLEAAGSTSIGASSPE